VHTVVLWGMGRIYSNIIPPPAGTIACHSLSTSDSFKSNLDRTDGQQSTRGLGNEGVGMGNL